MEIEGSEHPESISQGSDLESSRSYRAAWLIVAGYALLLLGWTFGNPPFAAPDEAHHYLRAIEVGRGELIGEKAAYPPGWFDDAGLAWVNQATRLVRVPPGLYTQDVNCNAAQALVTAACQDHLELPGEPTQVVTPVGTYQPLPYLLPGLATHLASTPLAADYLGRLASALVVLAMIAVAVLVSSKVTTGGWWLLGIVAAVTPMFMFIGSSLNPSGLEIASGFAFAAVMVRLGLDTTVPSWVWAAAGVSGVLLALSRAITPLWIVLLATLPLVLLGVKRAWGSIRDAAPLSYVAIASVGTAVLLNRAWELAYGPRLTVDLNPVGPTLSAALGQYSYLIRQEIGIFGYLEVSIPNSAYLGWFALLTVVLGLAFLTGTRRQRIALVVLSTAAVLVPALLWAAIVRHTGFGIQGRHVLALTVSVPLLAGGVLASRGYRLRSLVSGSFPRWFTAAAALVHLTAWLSNARRHAVGTEGPLVFFGRSEWVPPLGWMPWVTVVVAGLGMLVAASWQDTRGTLSPNQIPEQAQ